MIQFAFAYIRIACYLSQMRYDTYTYIYTIYKCIPKYFRVYLLLPYKNTKYMKYCFLLHWNFYRHPIIFARMDRKKERVYLRTPTYMVKKFFFCIFCLCFNMVTTKGLKQLTSPILSRIRLWIRKSLKHLLLEYIHCFFSQTSIVW